MAEILDITAAAAAQNRMDRQHTGLRIARMGLFSRSKHGDG